MYILPSFLVVMNTEKKKNGHPPGHPGGRGATGVAGKAGVPGAPGLAGNPGRPGPMGDAGMNGANGAEGARGVAVMLPPVENAVSAVPLVNTAYTPEQYAAYLNQAVAAAQVRRSSNLSQASPNLICLAYFSNLASDARVWKMVAAEVNVSWV